jgi:hypothetical protein
MLQLLKEIHPFIKNGDWFTSESLRKRKYFSRSNIPYKIYSRLSGTLVILYRNGYLERKERKRIFFNKQRGISFKGKYVYRLKPKYQSLPKNRLKLKL